VGVINDGHEHLAGPVDAEGFLDQQTFAYIFSRNLPGIRRPQEFRPATK
jgi:hypothetical protein